MIDTGVYCVLDMASIHSCFQVGLLHTTTRRLQAMSEPIRISRKSPRLVAVTAVTPARGNRLSRACAIMLFNLMRLQEK